MNDIEKLKHLVLAPWIVKATALIGVRRNVGGNQFRHAFATLGILLDYKYFGWSALLKASVIHDLIEDIPDTDQKELRSIDADAHRVVDIVLEVTRREGESKTAYLDRLLREGSVEAKILKVADRISNLTDLHRDQYSWKKMKRKLEETEKYILPMAVTVNKDMVFELSDLVRLRRSQMNYLRIPGGFRLYRFLSILF
jgi:GTP pyrophosphokinase